MFASFRGYLVKVLASPAPGAPAPLPPATRRVVTGAALAAGLWILIFKVQCFWGLETTSDLYSEVQQTTSWLEGRIYQDNCFGNILRMHTYFLSPLLAVLTVPFGAGGLFIALGLAVAAQIAALVRIQRLLAVPAAVALVYGLAATLMPLAMHACQDSVYGFHLELLEPALALWLAYFLLSRQWRGSLALTATLILFKEDAPLLVIVVAAMVLAEDIIRLLGTGPRRGWNWPATAALLLAAASVPLLLYFIKTQQVAGGVTNLTRVKVAGPTGLNGTAELFSYGVSNIGTWLKSGTVAGWLSLAVPATFGLILLRPHLLLAGVLTTLTAWLVQEDLLWAPRSVQALAFFQLAGGLALASAWPLFRAGLNGTWWGRTLAGALIVLVGWGAVRGGWKQWQAVPRTAEVYRLSPVLPVGAADRELADRLFARYRREAKKTDPVVSARYLFRYAHDRNLFWYDRLENRPKPEWILWDRNEKISGLWTCLKIFVKAEPTEYRLVELSGRFLLLKHKSAGDLVPPPPAEVATIPGESHGLIRLKVRFPPAFTSASEPLVAIGTPGRGELFFVRYFEDDRLALGFIDRGASVYMSEPVTYETGRVYEMEFFSGVLLPTEPAADSEGTALRLRYQNVVQIRWNGREILHSLSRHYPPEPSAGIYVGRNPVQAADVQAAFGGEVLETHRGGYPPDAAGVIKDCGAVRLVVELPGTSAGVPEPLVVVGVPGEASLGYIRLLPGGMARVGVEFWGVGAPESEPFPLPNPSRAELVFNLPVLFPPEGDFRWGEVPAAQQHALRTRCKVVVNGVTRLDVAVNAPIPHQATVSYATNPMGGSWVGPSFTGTLLQAFRLPLSQP